MGENRKRNHHWINLLLSVMIALPAWGLTTHSVQANEIQQHWAKAVLSKWKSKGYIRGFQDGSLKPDESVTRAQLAALINKSFGFTQTTSIAYKDVHPSNWFYNDIAIARAQGYMQGYQDSTFHPNQKITRQELAVVLTSIKTLKSSDSAYQMTDTTNSPAWSRSAIGAVIDSGLMKGDNKVFRPSDTTTRAEAVTVLERSLQPSPIPSKLPSPLTIYNTAGIYGPISSQQQIAGDVQIDLAGITLRNIVIEGDLILGEGIGEDDIMLDHVTVKGKTIIYGGRMIQLDHATLGTVIVNTKNSSIQLVSGSIHHLLIAKGASANKISTTTSSSIQTLTAYAQVHVSGDATIEKAYIHVAGVSITPPVIQTTIDEGLTALIAGYIVGSPLAITNLRKEDDNKKNNVISEEHTTTSGVTEQLVQRIEVSNGQVILYMNQSTSELVLSDMNITATLDNIPYTLTNLSYDQATGIIQFDPVPNTATTAKVLQITVAPSSEASRLSTTLQGSIQISPAIKQITDDIRIVLTWGELPYDEDAHLLGPTPEGYSFHTNISNREYNYKDENYARLDIDAVHSYGPEIMTIRKRVNGTYTFYVENFGVFVADTLRHSSATIQVYRSSSDIPIKTYHIPVGDGEESYWYVFDMNVDGDQISFIDQNKLTETAPSSSYPAPPEDQLNLQKELENILAYTVLPYYTEINQDISLRKLESNQANFYSNISQIELVSPQVDDNGNSVTADTYLIPSDYGEQIKVLRYNGSPYTAKYDVTINMILGEAEQETTVRVELPTIDTWLDQAATEAQQQIDDSSGQQDTTTLQNALDRKKALTSLSTISEKITALEELKSALSSF